MIKKVNEIIATRKQTNKWPDDSWFSIGPAWDLNLWVDDEGKQRAGLYQVRKGQTDVSAWLSLVV